MRISETERAYRREVIDRARHSTQMEGGRSSAAFRELQEAWVRGEIEMDEMIEAGKRLAGVRTLRGEGGAVPITEAEKAARRREVDEVRHSSAMEGAQSTPAFQEQQEAYVRGEIEADDLIEAARRLAQEEK